MLHGQGMELITHLHLVLKLRINGSILPAPTCLHVIYRDSFTFLYHTS